MGDSRREIEFSDAELRRVAERCVWWLPPERAVRRLDHFLACAMTHGSWEDIGIVKNRFSAERLAEALHHAPPGIFDPASWHYWHRVLGFSEVPELPRRRIPGGPLAPPTSKATWHLAYQRDLTP
jgi:hypothetical protein